MVDVMVRRRWSVLSDFSECPECGEELGMCSELSLFAHLRTEHGFESFEADAFIEDFKRGRGE